MLKRKYEQLAVYEVEKDIPFLSLKEIRDLICLKGTDTVYITKYEKLYGLICLGDVLRECGEGIQINKSFVYVEGFDAVKAHRLFSENCNIHKIPVVDGQGKLIADYDRWEDMSFVDRNQEYWMQRESAKKCLGIYKNIYVVEPSYKSNRIYLRLLNYLKDLQVQYVVKTKQQVQFDFLSDDLYIFLSQDELRAMQCIQSVNLMEMEKQCKRRRYVTYQSLIEQIMQAENLGNISENREGCVNEKATILLAELKKEGINSICINGGQALHTEYVKRIRKELRERSKVSPVSKEPPWLLEQAAEEFWCELYELEDYKNGLVQKELADSFCTYRRRDITGKYCNARDGKRCTLYQPKEYIGTIYFLGPCTFWGYFSEDQYTIESFLQKKLIETGYPYRVVNYASPVGGGDSEIDVMLMEIGKYSTNDIVVYLSCCGSVLGIENRNLWDMCAEQNIPSEWMTNGPLHINYKACNLLSDSIFEMLRSKYLKKECVNIKRDVRIDFCELMKDYVYRKYIRHYFEEFSSDRYNTIGSIVMNCNPFSKGHRYLIEQASSQVDLLVVFVVEEDASLFSFEERYRMVKKGVGDIENVMVVPSGEFILSNATFWEYFSKNETGVTDLSARHDINIFAEYIAKPLRITHRFVGEEPFDKVTGVYNQVMKEILPKKGIQFVEIPRMEVEGEIVSASKVRNYMENGAYEKAFRLLPQTTISYIND